MTSRAKTISHWGAEFSPAPYSYRSDALAQVTAMTGFGSLHRCLDKIVLGHRKYGRYPQDTFLENIMRVVENNGQVTLPVSRGGRNHWKVAAGVAAGIAAIGALAVALWH
jgi:hypothetical protein